MARSVVCVSRSAGAGGEEVGKLVAERLGFLYVDEEVVARAAARSGIDIERVADEERRKSMFAGLLEYLAEGGGAVVLAAAPVQADGPSGEAVRAFIREAVQDFVERGRTVIVAHAASFAVGAGEETLRVLVTAPQETRARRLAEAGGLDAEEAGRLVRRSDGDRSDYLKRFYGVPQELPTHYDLVINTDTISFAHAADVIAKAAGA